MGKKFYFIQQFLFLNCYLSGRNMNNHALERHIERLKGGDSSAFDYIYEQTNRSVYFAALYIVRDKMYAEDICAS